jgi:hypothetical protein
MRYKKWKIVSVSWLGLVLACWFLFVDWSWFVDECTACGHAVSVTQYRCFEVPVQQSVFQHTLIDQATASVAPGKCSHENVVRWHKQRWWGLLICGAPCHNGIHQIASPEQEIR